VTGVAPTDEALIALAARGDRSAAESLVLRHQRGLLNFFYRFVNDPVLAEDLAQETFLRMVRSAHTFEPRAPFGVWLYRIARNVCLNEIKACKPRRGRLDRDGLVPGPEHDLSHAQLDARVRFAVRKLPERQRLALVLRRFEGLSVSEVADVMETTRDAVDALMARATASLRRSLADLLDADRSRLGKATVRMR
jgi:RNA polymerase sigma-70 factor, ECF subfamily